ncbi:MAG: bifunctional metallophosphatase/5'-nucleotidase [Phycisphaerae bacterium]
MNGKFRRLAQAALVLLATVLTAGQAPQKPASAGSKPTTTAPQTATQPATVTLRFLHINDSHGKTLPFKVLKMKRGGYTRLGTLVKQRRKATGADRTFVVHAGDILSRGDRITRETLGEANIAILNEIGFDYWTPGNGDFYDGLKVLTARIDQFKGKALTSNVTRENSDKAVGEQYSIEKVGDVRVAFFGLCNRRVGTRSAKAVEVADAVKTARKLVPKLQKQADVVVAVTHLGLTDDRKLARQVHGIDLIIGGHTHSTLWSGLKETGPGGRKVLIVQASDHLQRLGEAELTLRKQTGGWAVVSSSAQLHSVHSGLKPDPAVLKLLRKYWLPTTQPAGK